MSYLVLARKWRPRRFAELVGQEHVIRALTNALETGRVHHAFLLTGTRGVGKTTIARIFAKSLNCERNAGAEPCGECGACSEIDAGRFVDLLEIDAASNTGVDDVRELIDNAQYMPTRGKYKVYLIDEVHMLSKSAFNALLKTLEEPPAHVKFLLATTDPQKLPVTVLSRCLQFNLKRLDEAQIRGQLLKILTAEGIASEPGALALLARGADGSVRDGLSLLDQAIAFTGAGGDVALDEAGVRTMLGTVDRTQVGGLLQALSDGDGAVLMQRVETLAGFAPDFGSVLEELAAALHRIQLRQLVPGMAADVEVDALAGFDPAALAVQVAPELVQLWYQMAIGGRRDLALAPSPRVGFEMALLRMLAFRPGTDGGAAARSTPPSTATAGAGSPSSRTAPLHATAAAPVAAPIAPSGPLVRRGETPTTELAAVVPPPALVAAALPPVRVAESMSHVVAPAVSAALASADDWIALVGACALRGPVLQLASYAGFVDHRDGVLSLSLPASDDHLRSDNLIQQLRQALAGPLGGAPAIRFVAAADHGGETVHMRGERQRGERQQAAEAAYMGEPVVQRLMQHYGAKLVPGSIQPHPIGSNDEN